MEYIGSESLYGAQNFLHMSELLDTNVNEKHNFSIPSSIK